MKRALIILAMAGSVLAGYCGRELQDVIDRSVKNPIGPYVVQAVPGEGSIIKTHTRTGRMWARSGSTGWKFVEQK